MSFRTKTRAQIHNAASVSDLNRDDVMIVDSDMDVIPAVREGKMTVLIYFLP